MKAQLWQVKIFNAVSSFNKFWNTKYYQNEPKPNGVYSRNNLPKIKDGADVLNLDEYSSIETHWIALYVNGNNWYHCCWTYFKGNLKIHRKQKYNDKYLYNTSTQVDNMWILLHQIH